METKQNLFNDDDRLYLQMLQDNIARMAGNSANCKTWAVTLAAGLLAIGAGMDLLRYWLLIALLPIIVLWWLDTFYLGLERGMRNRQRAFLTLFEKPDLEVEAYRKALFDFTPLKSTKKENCIVSTLKLAFAQSVGAFYGVLLLVVIALTVMSHFVSLTAYSTSYCQ